MHELKIPEKLVALVALTLKETKIQLRIQDDFTKRLVVKNGVRQGDALACLLFNIAFEKVIRDSKINIRGNIFNKSVQILAYAVDIGIIVSIAQALKHALEQSAKRINLSENENKTKYLPCLNSSSCASASSNARELDEQILEVKINPQEKNTVSDTSTNKDTLSKEKELENENEETKLIRNDFAHYVGRAFAGRRGAGIRHTPESKNYSIKNLIESSEIFETDKEFLQSVIDGVLAEKAAKIEQEKFKLESERAAKIEQEKFKLESEKAKIEFEKIKLEQLKKELELTNAKCKLSPAQEKSEHFESVPSDIENLIKSIKTLTIPIPSNTEAYNLFFQSLEKAFKTKNVEDKFKAEILLNMLGEKVGNLMIYVKQEELGDYEKNQAVSAKTISTNTSSIA
ncbi:putative endonuclease-reverse transcriptase [Trichonephila clavipes]|nr:putative endonuclease-reverse transcriptase [Trichonephila clavipes]